MYPYANHIIFSVLYIYYILTLGEHYGIGTIHVTREGCLNETFCIAFLLFTVVLLPALFIMPSALFAIEATPVTAPASPGERDRNSLPDRDNGAKQVQLITVLIPGLSLQDLPQCPTLTRLAREGAVGLLNTQNNGTRRISAAYLTLSAGKKAACPEEAARAWQSEERFLELTAAEFYQRYTGISADTSTAAPANTVFLPTCSNCKR